jgi:3-methyladenine DNA glycosylase AlkD
MANLNNKISVFINKELRKLSDKKFARSRNRLIGKKVISYGVKTQEIRKIAKEYFKRFQKETKESWLKIVKELMSTKVFENQMTGIFLLSKIGGKLSISELEKLIKKYINNWATCDTMSSEVAAKVLIGSPERIEALYTWAKSKNIWLKRAALTTTVKLKDKIENWQEVACQILSLLEKEKEPTLKKAVHWLKKEVLR